MRAHLQLLWQKHRVFAGRENIMDKTLKMRGVGRGVISRNRNKNRLVFIERVAYDICYCYYKYNVYIAF